MGTKQVKAPTRKTKPAAAKKATRKAKPTAAKPVAKKAKAARRPKQALPAAAPAAAAPAPVGDGSKYLRPGRPSRFEANWEEFLAKGTSRVSVDGMAQSNLWRLVWNSLYARARKAGIAMTIRRMNDGKTVEISKRS